MVGSVGRSIVNIINISQINGCRAKKGGSREFYQENQTPQRTAFLIKCILIVMAS